VISTADFRNGFVIEVDGQLATIISFQHVKPGKGGAFVRTKLRFLQSGATVDRTFRAGEKFPRATTESKTMSFLYQDGEDLVLMDKESYEQISSPAAAVENIDLLSPNTDVQVLFIRGEPFSVQLPTFVELAVVRTDPGVKGDTVSNVMKPAELETGATVNVPLFVNEGDRLRIDTRTREYSTRV
jgi:elongation factor P